MTTDPDALTERIANAVRQALSEGEALQCTRVWEAWHYGTMTDEDFADASDGPLSEEIAASVLSIVEDVERQARAEGWADCERSLTRWFIDPFAGDDAPRNPYRTTETGDNDE